MSANRFITTAQAFRYSPVLCPNMTAREDKNLGKQDKSEPHEMTAIIAQDLRVYAGRKWPTMNHKWRKARLASLLGLSERRVKSIYEAEQTARLRADEEARIKALIGAEEERAYAEDNALAERIAELEATVAFLVEALARDEMEATRASAHRQGR